MQVPRNQTAEILYELLNNDQITRRDLVISCGILSPTSGISELRHDHNLNIVCTDIKTKNKHNRAITFGAWSLPQDEIEKAKKIYGEINQ